MPKKTYKINVTPLDIEKAIKSDSYKCVVAQAVRREIPEASNVMVDVQTIRFSLEGYRLQYLAPLKVSQYVADFDAGDPIEPLTFSLRNPRVTRTKKGRIAGAAKPAPHGSAEHLARIRKRHPVGETLDFVGTKGDVTKQPILSEDRTIPTWRSRTRQYGVRMLRINQDLVALENELAAVKAKASTR